MTVQTLRCHLSHCGVTMGTLRSLRSHCPGPLRVTRVSVQTLRSLRSHYPVLKASPESLSRPLESLESPSRDCRANRVIVIVQAMRSFHPGTRESPESPKSSFRTCRVTRVTVQTLSESPSRPRGLTRVTIQAIWSHQSHQSHLSGPAESPESLSRP